MIDKKLNYVEQDGYNNYIKNSDSVTVPRKFKSKENATPTKLAYITKDEAKMLKKMKKGTPHKGPSGVPSYDDFDAQGNFTSGAAMSAMESGSTNSRDRAEVQASNYGAPSGAGPGVKTQKEQDLRSSVIAAGAGQRVNPGFFDSKNTVSPSELAAAKAFNPTAFNKVRGGGLGNFISSGGFLGNIVRGIGQKMGLGKKYNDPTYDMSSGNDLGLHADRFPSGFGIPNFESGDGDYDMLGNKINEITGEIISPTGESLGTIPGYPGGSDDSGGITTIPTGDDGGSEQYVNLIDQYVPEAPVIPDEAFSQRFKVKDEFRKAKGNDLIAEDKRIAELMKNYYT